jgi:hypothetical protein
MKWSSLQTELGLEGIFKLDHFKVVEEYIYYFTIMKWSSLLILLLN